MGAHTRNSEQIQYFIEREKAFSSRILTRNRFYTAVNSIKNCKENDCDRDYPRNVECCKCDERITNYTGSYNIFSKMLLFSTRQ